MASNPYHDPSKPHHTPEGFRNNYTSSVNKSAAELLRWRREAARQGLPRPPLEPVPTAAADLAFIHANTGTGAARQPAVTWIGHVTMLVQAGGLNVLTDPVFGDRASPLAFAGPRRAQPPGVALADLPAIDVVLLSHNHYDHLDASSVEALDRRAKGSTLFLVPLGLKPWLARRGIGNAVELDWWEHHAVGGSEFHLTPVQHWSARGVGDRNRTLWGGWACFSPGLHWYFSGDSGYTKDFADTGERFAARNGPGGFDLALLGIGAYEPRWFMKEQHMNPAEAVQAHKDLRARQSIGVHWGTFSLTDEPLDEPPRALARARTEHGLAETDFSVMKIGETRRVAGRP